MGRLPAHGLAQKVTVGMIVMRIFNCRQDSRPARIETTEVAGLMIGRKLFTNK
jgi:hypothetical protein